MLYFLGLLKPNVEKMEKRRDIEGLIRTLSHKDSSVRSAALGALVRIGEPAVDPLIQALKDKGVTARWELVVTLRLIGHATAVEPIIQTLKDKDPRVRREAVEFLKDLGNTRAVEPLIQTLNDEDKGVRLVAAEALGKMRDTRAVEPLIRALGDPYWTVQASVAEALGNIGDARAVDPLFQIPWNTEREVREKAAEALGKIGEPAVRYLTQALRRGDLEKPTWFLDRIGWKPRDDAERAYHLVARAAVLTQKEWDQLAMLGKPAVEPLIHALEHDHWSVRTPAAEALGKIGSGRAQGALSYLFGESTETRVDIGKLGIEALAKALEDETVNVRKEAAKALALIGDLRAAEGIIDWLFLSGRSPVTGEEEELNSWIEMMKNLFGDYTALILKTSTHFPGRGIPYGEDFGIIGHSLEESTRAIHELSKIPTQISSNILHRISRRKDVEVMTTWNGDYREYRPLGLESHRETARKELERRGNPPYDPSAYLDKETWKM